MSEQKYTAGLMSQCFWYQEFKAVASLYHEGVSFEEIRRQCVEENLLGTANVARAKYNYGYLSTRVKAVGDDLLEIYLKSDIENQKIITLISLMRVNRLFREFVYEVYRDKLILGGGIIEKSDVNVFFSRKEQESETVASFKDTTVKTLKAQFVRFLFEAGLLSESGETIKPLLSFTLEDYLKQNDIYSYKAITGEV